MKERLSPLEVHQLQRENERLRREHKGMYDLLRRILRVKPDRYPNAHPDDPLQSSWAQALWQVCEKVENYLTIMQAATELEPREEVGIWQAWYNPKARLWNVRKPIQMMQEYEYQFDLYDHEADAQREADRLNEVQS